MKKILMLTTIFGLGLFIAACNFDIDDIFGPHRSDDSTGCRHHHHHHDDDDTVVVIDSLK
jgi:hypothetical protein